MPCGHVALLIVQRHGDEEGFAVAVDLQHDGSAFLSFLADDGDELVGAGHRLEVGRQDHVAGTDAGFGGRSVTLHAYDEQPLHVGRKLKRTGILGSKRLDAHAEIAAFTLLTGILRIGVVRGTFAERDGGFHFLAVRVQQSMAQPTRCVCVWYR